MYVLRFDPANPAAGYTTTLSIPLNYTKAGIVLNGTSWATKWNPWSDNYAASPQYTFASLLPNTAYTLSMPPPSGYGLPPANAASLPGASVTSNDPISDTRDSDATLVGSTAQIAYTTGGAGQNNYGLTFGFAQTAQFGDQVWIESDTDGLASTGVITSLAGMVITATNGSNVYTTTTSANGYYSFTVPAGTYTVTYGSASPSSTPGGNSEGGNEGSYQQGSNPDQSYQNNTIVTVGGGEANWTIDFAFYLLGLTPPTALPEESEPEMTVRFYLPLVSSHHPLGVAAESVPVLEGTAAPEWAAGLRSVLRRNALLLMGCHPTTGSRVPVRDRRSSAGQVCLLGRCRCPGRLVAGGLHRCR